MSTEMPGALASDAAKAVDKARAASSQWIETALAMLFAAAAVFFASFLAVVAGLA